MKKSVSVVGFGCSPNDLTPAHTKQINQADILVGSKRIMEYFKDVEAEKIYITKDIKGLTRFIKDRMETKKVTVIASGDPLFYGIGSLISETLGSENVMIYPNISVVSAAFSRIKASWHDAQVISLHGRKSETELLYAMNQKDKIAVYTDPERNPAWIAKLLIDHGTGNYNFWVMERLGYPLEKIGRYELETAAKMHFDDPNILILIRRSGLKRSEIRLQPGMPDNLFAHHEGLITKAEVRSVTLSKLCLESGHVLWDLGAGSGSVAIEASLFIKHGKIIAVEQRADRLKHIRENKKRFGVNNLEIIHGTLPFNMDKFPAPDRIFIGGGGKDLVKIIKFAANYLKKNGIIVINTILIKNIDNALKTLNDIGLFTEIVQMQVSRQTDMPWSVMLKAQNPVWIISGKGE